MGEGGGRRARYRDEGLSDMARPSPTEFVRQVRAEATKVVWPTRKETTLTTVMVLVLSAVTALFFFFVDWLLSLGVTQILHLSTM